MKSFLDRMMSTLAFCLGWSSAPALLLGVSARDLRGLMSLRMPVRLSSGARGILIAERCCISSEAR
jgi:hypothetical protein